MRSFTKFGPNWFSRFYVYWVQTDRDRQAKYILACIYLFLDAAPLPGAHNGAESSIIRSQSPGANPGICPIVTYLYKY